jgi:hypothetical protein
MFNARRPASAGRRLFSGASKIPIDEPPGRAVASISEARHALQL